MSLEKGEFEKFLAAVYASGIRNGVEIDKMATILAEAIKEREDALAKDKSGETKKVETVRVEEVVVKQPLYGPPPFKKEEPIPAPREIQPLYGPPPFMDEVVVEVVEMEQALYGPPPMPKIDPVVSGEGTGKGRR